MAKFWINHIVQSENGLHQGNQGAEPAWGQGGAQAPPTAKNSIEGKEEGGGGEKRKEEEGDRGRGINPPKCWDWLHMLPHGGKLKEYPLHQQRKNTWTHAQLNSNYVEYREADTI